VDAIRRAYGRRRAIYYAAEARWPECPFWRRRHHQPAWGVSEAR
jgi:hypothetical protein